MRATPVLGWSVVLALLATPPLSIALEAPDDAAGALARALRDGEHTGVTGFVLDAGGRRLAEFVAPEVRDAGADLRSATKSITALLVGIAIDRGELGAVDTPVIDLLPDYRQALGDDPRKRAITIEDLLTMRSGLDCDDWDRHSPGHEDRMYRKRDWLAFWAGQRALDAPGTRFRYCTGNVIALGAILANATGQSVDDYAQERLFTPLGISDAHWARWNRKRAIDSGGHLQLSPNSLARVGALMLGRGEYRGRRVVSRAWVEAMTTARAPIPGLPTQYGYLWWLDQTSNPALPRVRLWRAVGNGGQHLVVMPDLDAVAVFTGTRFNRGDADEPLLWLRDALLPMLRERKTLPSIDPAQGN